MWAVGVTLFCLAFSRTPFDGGTVMEVYENIRTQAVTYPDNTDEALRDLLSRLLERDPGELLPPSLITLITRACTAKRIDAPTALAHPYLQGTIKRTPSASQ
jgi:serine/threonine protein kinase